MSDLFQGIKGELQKKLEASAPLQQLSQQHLTPFVGPRLNLSLTTVLQFPLENKNNKQAQQDMHLTLYIFRTPKEKQLLGSSCSSCPSVPTATLTAALCRCFYFPMCFSSVIMQQILP